MKNKFYKGYRVTSDGVVYGLKNQPLKPSIGYNGYARVNIYENGVVERPLIHRLVMKLFIGESDLTVDHINGDKLDNRLENLRYVSRAENIREYWNKLISKEDRLLISKSNMKSVDLANMYNVSVGTINNIKKRYRNNEQS